MKSGGTIKRFLEHAIRALEERNYGSAHTHVRAALTTLENAETKPLLKWLYVGTVEGVEQYQCTLGAVQWVVCRGIAPTWYVKVGVWIGNNGAEWQFGDPISWHDTAAEAKAIAEAWADDFFGGTEV